MNSRDMRTMPIGGAYVRRVVQYGSIIKRPGQIMTAEEVMAIPAANRTSLVDNGYISPFPKAPEIKPVNTRRLVIESPDGGYSVVEGVVINTVPLTLDDAKKLAQNGKPGRPAQAIRSPETVVA